MGAIIDDEQSKNRKMNYGEDFDKLPFEFKKELAKRTGFSEKEFSLMRQLLVESQQEGSSYTRQKKDREILDTMDFQKISDTLFAKSRDDQALPFVSDFDASEMVKLAPKNVEKVSRKERVKRQREREEQLHTILAQTNVDPDIIMKVASEGGEI